MLNSRRRFPLICGEIGINAVNAQRLWMPVEDLADRLAGRICVRGKDHHIEICAPCGMSDTHATSFTS